MYFLQGSIGALNDWRDADLDRRAGRPKPLAAGVIPVSGAAGVWLLTGLVGVALVLPSGQATLAIALAGTTIGYIYDLALSTTAWSWLPWAAGIPLLPIFAWYGSTGGLPQAFLLLIPLAATAGTALAIANALADLERDLAAGARTIAVGLGREAAWRVGALLQCVVIVAAITSFVAWNVAAGSRSTITLPVLGGLLVGGALIGAGLATARREVSRGEIAWEVQALGVGVIAIAWLAGVGAA